MALTGALSASAESFPSDGSPISLGTVYEVSFGQSYNATLAVPSTGVLVQNGSHDLMLQDAGDPKYLGYGEYGQIFSWNVEGGKTYTIMSGFVFNDGKVCFEMEGESGLTLVSASPAEGEALSITSGIDLTFNSDVSCSSAFLQVGDAQHPITKNSSMLNTLSFDISIAMRSLYDTGEINKDGGDAIKLVVNDVRTSSGVKYGENGVLEIAYVAAPRQVDLVSYNIPLPLKSYYVPGSPEAVATFNFDAPINPEGVELTIFCGDMESGDFYSEAVPAQVDGAVVTVDLSGKLRDLTAYVTAPQQVIELKLSNIFDLGGRPAVGSGSGSYASYSFNVTYDYIAPENVSCEFTPGTGSSLAGVNEIEIWFNKSGIFTYDGVEFSYRDGAQEKSVVVANADLKIEHSGDDTTITVAVPEEVKGKIGITVSLHNLTATDGYDHLIKAEYDMFVVSLVSPIQPGQTIATTGDEDFVFDVYGAEKYFYLRYDFYNADGAEGWVYGTDLTKQEDGTWTAYNGNFPCFNNYQPRMVISAYYTSNDWYMQQDPVETYEFLFYGAQIPFTYSDVKFESIDPAPGTELIYSDDIVFTVKYDGLVRIDPSVSGVVAGMGAGNYPFKKIEAVHGEFDEAGEYANTWKLYPDMAVLADRTSIEIAVKAYDENDKVVEGNMGGEEYDYLAFEYLLSNEANLLDLDVTPGAGKVDELSKFVVSYNGKGVGINYSYTGDEQVRIVSNKGKAVVVIERDAMEVVSEQTGVDEFGQPIYSEITSVVFSVAPAITEEGDYMLYIPANYFTIGSQFDVHGNAAAEIEYTIGGSVTPGDGVELTVSPAAGEVAALTRIDFLAPGIEDAFIDYENKIAITNAEGAEVYAITGAEIDAYAFDMMTWTFNGYYIEPKITEQGVYTLSVPAGMFIFGDDLSAALTAVYTVGISSVSSVMVETADTYNVYTISGVCVLSTADAADLSTLRPGLYIINGKKVLVK